MLCGHLYHYLSKLEIEANHKQAESEKKQYDDLLRERDILSKVIMHIAITLKYIEFFCQSLRKAEGFTEKQEHLVKIHDQTIKNLQQEIAVCYNELLIQ